MAFSQTQLDALETAIATGVMSVDYGDRKVTYRSLGDMLKVRDMARQDLGLSTGAPKSVKTATRNGF